MHEEHEIEEEEEGARSFTRALEAIADGDLVFEASAEMQQAPAGAAEGSPAPPRIRPGHRRLAGFVTDVEVFGGRMCRIDIPSEPPVTQLYGAGAIYAVTPSTEEICRGFAKRNAGPQPVSRWELPAPTPDYGPADGGGYDDDDDTEDGEAVF